MLESRSENPKEKSDGFLARHGGEPDSAVPYMQRGSDHDHPRTLTLPHLFTPPVSRFPALHSSSGTVIHCWHDLPARPTQQQQQQQGGANDRGLGGLFAKHPSWAPGVLGALRSGAVAPAGCVPYTGCTPAYFCLVLNAPLLAAATLSSAATYTRNEWEEAARLLPRCFGSRTCCCFCCMLLLLLLLLSAAANCCATSFCARLAAALLLLPFSWSYRVSLLSLQIFDGSLFCAHFLSPL